MSRSFRLGELAEHVGGRVEGDAGVRIEGIATLDEASAAELSFLTNVRYRKAAQATRAGALLVGPDSGLERPARLVADEPYVALAALLELFHPATKPPPGVSPDARVDASARIGADVHVGPFSVVERDVELGDGVVIAAGCVVGAGCRLGAGSELRPRVVLYAGTHVGRRCLVHAGVVLGADGFGFATSKQGHRKVPQVGRVVLEDDVEIGANSAVDRAMLGQTRVGEGSKIDDLVMLAHGVRLGPGALVAGQAGVAGSARLGARATLAGQAGVAGHLELGDGVIVAAKSAVFADQPDRAFVAGIPAVDHRRWKRVQAAASRLPELQRELRRLRRRVEELEQRLAGRD